MEGKPTFSGAAPESHPSNNPEVAQWRKKLGDPSWVDRPVEATTVVQPELDNQILRVSPEAKPVIQEAQEKPVEAPVDAIDEALTDSKADIVAVQAMMGHFIQENNGQDA